jgi:hypothetical protein
MPLPLSDYIHKNTFNMSTTEIGGALSSFGVKYGFSGADMEPVFQFSTMGITMNEAASLLKLPLPEYIKMDVDGIEHLILSKGNFVLSEVKGVLIEVTEDFKQQCDDVKKHLEDSGLTFKEKRHALMYEDIERPGNGFNQIWHRL